jgi:AraC-like DNA-binding protein
LIRRSAQKQDCEQFTIVAPCDGLVAVTAVSRRAFARHTHEGFGIGVIVAGAQRSASGRGQVEASAGQIITVNPNEVHDGLPICDRSRAWRMIYLNPSILGHFDFGEIKGRELHHPVLEHRAVARSVLALHHAAVAGDAVTETAESLLPIILAALLSEQTSVPGWSAGVRRAVARIDDAPEVQHPIAALANEAGLSRWHFIRAFASATGLTPHAYRRQRQLQRARAGINAGLPLSQAAALAGFADQSHMTRVFTASYGYTPGVLAATYAGNRRPTQDNRAL